MESTKMPNKPNSRKPKSPNLSVSVSSQYVQPRTRAQMLPTPSNSTRVSDLKISIKSSLIPTQQSHFSKQAANSNNLVRFVRNNTFNQYLQNRQCAQSQLMDSLKNSTASNTKTNSFDDQQLQPETEKNNEEDDSSDDAFIYGTTNIKQEQHTANAIPINKNKKRLFSSLSNSNPHHQNFEPLAKYPRFAQHNSAKKAKTPNVNIWSWKESDVIEWLLSFEIGKLYLCQFARSEINGLKLTLLNETSLKQMGVSLDTHRNYLLQRIQALIKIQNDHNQHIPFRCLYCNVYSPSRVVILQHMNQSHQLSLPILLGKQTSIKQEGKTSVPDYAQHYNEKTSRWTCSQSHCNSSFSQRSNLRNHMIDKHQIVIAKLKPGRPKESNLVNQTTKKSSSHRNASKDTQCPFCKKTYSSVYYLNKHTKKSHNWDLTAGAAVNEDEDESVAQTKQKRKKKKTKEESEYDDDDDGEETETDTDMISSRDSSSSSYSEYTDNKNQEFKCNMCNEVCSSGLDLLAHVAQHD